MNATFGVFQGLNKTICTPLGVQSRSVLLAVVGQRLLLCNGKKREKKRPFFLLGGLFGKTAALPTAANLQRVLKERSPLFSLNPSMPLNELLPLIPRNGSPASQAAVWVVLMSMGNVPQGSPPVQPLPENTTLWEVQHFSHVCIIAVILLLDSFHPLLKEFVSLPAIAGPRISSIFFALSLKLILTAHVGEIFLVFENRSQRDIGGYNFLDAGPCTPNSFTLSAKNPEKFFLVGASWRFFFFKKIVPHPVTQHTYVQNYP